MTTWRKVGCCLAMVAGVALGAFGYNDELVTIDDDSVVVKANEDGSSVYIFTNTAASATVTTRTQVMFVECLVVGGGGAGGWTVGGGGGGGGVRHAQGIGLFLPAGETMTATVGAGGVSPLGSGWQYGGNGDNSLLQVGSTTYTGHGGGGGGGWDSTIKKGRSGGSSGGSCQSGGAASAVAKDNAEMGNVGGASTDSKYPGGGGGATEPGAGGTSTQGGKGGEGYTCSITGEPVVYGSGGGAGGGTGNSFAPGNVGGTNGGTGANNNGQVGQPGVPGTGGGGGGGGYSPNSGTHGGDGGSGIVVMVLVPPTEELRSLKVDPVPDQDFLGGNVCPLPVVRDLESETVLVRNEHYELSWSNNDRLGTGKVKVQGLGAYRYSVDETTFGIKDGCLDYDFACEPITVGSRAVYVISNATAETVVRIKAAMVLEEALVVAGGGAGGYTIGGGGGGGGVIHLTPSAALKAGDHLVLSVGRGGSPTENSVLNAGYAQNNWPWGGSGGDSSLVISAAGICALAHGGGGGGGWDSRHKEGISGGSSGGSCQKTVTQTVPTKSEGELGNVGGAADNESPGGGGGATQAGSNGTASGAAGAGGEGYACAITGVEKVYGSGGGGGKGNSCTAVGAGGTNAGAGGGGNATNGFGGGGGGGTYPSSIAGGAGGCGTVILSFSSAVSVPNRFVVEDIPNQAVTGSAVEPLPVVRDKATGDVLARGADYEVAYEGNVGPGTGYAVVTGIGGYANNRWRVPFNILPSAAVNAKWTYADGKLTEVVPLESPRTPWVFTLTEAGLLTRATRGGSTELDLGSAALPTDAPEIVSVAAASFAESLNLVSVRMSSNVTTIAANAFKSTTALNTIRFDGWYDLATENKAIGNWADRACRFVVPGDSKSWLGFIATTQFVEPWDSLSDAVKGEYLALYGEDAHLIPVGLTVSGATAVKRTWIVKTDAVIASSIVEVVEPEAEFGSVTRDPAPGADGSYAPGTAVTVTFVPASGVTFNRWNGDVRSEDARNLSVVVIAEGMKTLSPDFSANFLVYKNGKLTDNVEIVNATGETNAIVVTGAERYNNGVLDLSKPIYGGGKITGVADSAFASYKCTAGRLLLPETIERLEYRAFDCCNTLTNITPLLPASIRYLGNSAFSIMPNLRGNLTIGFGTEEDGRPIVIAFGRGNVDETNSARTFQQAQLGPLVRIGPGVVSVPTGLLQYGQKATNIWISAGSTKVEPLAFRRMHGCDIVFEGDMPVVSQNSFELELDTYKFKQRYYSPWTGGKTLKNWAAYLRDETKVKPWSKLTAEEKQKYFTAFPNADRRDHPYGLTLTVSDGSALPADQWVFAPYRVGFALLVK